MASFSRFFMSMAIILSLQTGLEPSGYQLSAQVVSGHDLPEAELAAFWADSVLISLTQEERIAQLIMVPAWSDSRYARDEEVSALVSGYNIGGIVFMRGGPVRQAKLTNRYQSLSKTPLMIAMDGEWGLGMRLDSTLVYPQNLTLGAVQDEELIYEMGVDVARQMRRLGVQINFAPVLDVNVNPRNPVIGSRSFGGDAGIVSGKALQFMQGMQDNGVMAVGKHFPGHGDTDRDSHHTLPVINHSRVRFDTLELVPFRTLIDSGLGGIMTAHLHIPAIDSTAGLASSLSSAVVGELLREEMGFGGLVFTDGLNMSGVSDHFPPGELEVRALMAGNDILLFPSDVGMAIDAIRDAVETGLLAQDVVDERCRRVLTAKYRMGLARRQEIITEGLYRDLNNPGSELVRRKLIGASVTLLENRNGIIPVSRLDTLGIATVSIGGGESNEFRQTLDLYAPMKHFTISRYATLEQFGQLMRELERFNLVIVGIHDGDGRRSRQYGISPQTSYFVRKISERNNVILAIFTSPYGLEFFDDLSNVKGLVMAYEDHHLAREYSAQVIFGSLPATGRLPVSAGTRYAAGDGYSTRTRARLRYSIPEEAGLDSRVLEKIDSIVNNAISLKAMPGAQVLVARGGVVIYHKTFGYHTYRQEIQVRANDLYDIASVTKIASSVPAIMKLIEEGRLDIEQTLGFYLPELAGTNKENLRIKDVLTHQAGLQPWIPFYYDTFESLVPDEELFSRRVSVNYPYMLAANMFMNRNYRFAANLFTDLARDEYTIRVANRMFMNKFYRDSIYKRINDSPLRQGNQYLYSDLGYYYLKNIIERISQESLEMFTEKNFYRPLGACRITYLPLEKYRADEIVPTENDMVFRRQLVHGHVHDPGTAMMGGVGGHAGLFANANDLAKLMQLYLQNGEYGGENFFERETILRFTSAPNSANGNRRGIGFDKPEKNPSGNGPSARSASAESYGHSGFTGTMAWVDPEQELVYVFLSNRIHPDQFNNKLQQLNIRTKIQQVIYDSIMH